MVQEVRRIMLTADELFSAFEGYRRITPNFLPEGELIECTPENGSIRVTVKMPSASGPVKVDLVFKGTDATKPLIRFCIENNIMIPKDGQKTLHVRDGAASLYIVYDLDLGTPWYAKKEGANNIRPLMPSDILKAVAVS